MTSPPPSYSSSSTPPKQILLTGATGYIGGTILTTLLTNPPPSLRPSLPITCLLRSPSAAAALTATHGPALVRPVLYAGLHDLAAATAAAASADVVINAALGYHRDAALALVRGLAARRRRRKEQKTTATAEAETEAETETGGAESEGEKEGDVWYVHLSGASNLGDRRASGAWTEPQRVFDDERDDVCGWERRVEAAHPYVQRGAELAVVDAGLALGVRTVVVMPPMVYGRGAGAAARRQSTQVPAYVEVAARRGRAVVIGGGRGWCGHVHVEDLAGLYGILVERIVAGGGDGVPVGREGIVFAADGRHTWRGIAEAVAEVGCREGRLRDAVVEEVDVAEGTRIFAEAYLGEVDEEMVELGLASTCETVPSVARRLGWKPTRGGEEGWKKGLREDIRAAFESC